MRVLADAWGRTPTWEETRPYWEELVDLNRNRVRSGNVDLIYVDEVFQLPAIPPDPTSPEAATPAEDAPPEETPPEVPTAGPEEGAEKASAEDDEIVSGADEEPAATETVEGGPPEPAESPSTPTTQQQRSWELPPPTSTPDWFDLAPAHSEDGDESGLPFLPVAAGLAGLGILAYSLVGIIDRRRRILLAHRPPDRQPTPPPADTRPTEHNLRAAAASEGFEFCDLALRSLSMELIATKTKPPPVAGAYLDNDGLRLLLDGPPCLP